VAEAVDKLVPMASAAAPIFYTTVQYYLTWLLLIVFLVIELVALVNCLMQRSDAFPVVGSLSKTAWLAILGGAVILTLLCGSPSTGISIFGFIAITAAAIYMLDVRPALRDATDGTGNW
jgi:hypothetical protein